MSAGSFWRSPSEVTTTSPRAWSKPAENAAVWPKLRRSTMARTAGIARPRASSTASVVPSRDPSSTRRISKGRPMARQAAP